MSDAEESSPVVTIPPGWARIWIGAALLGVAWLLRLAYLDSGGSEAEGRAVLTILMLAAFFFGTVHLLIGCVVQGSALHERTRTSADRS